MLSSPRSSRACCWPSSSGAGKCVLAHKEIAGAKGGRAFQQQHGAHGGQRCGELRPMELPVISDGPGGQQQTETPGQLFRSGGEVGILHRAEFAELRREQHGRGAERNGVWRGVEFVEKVRQAAVKRIALDGKRGDFSQGLWPPIFPSSNNPSTRYCVSTGMRLAG